jgi:hypothetical protein
MHTLWCTISFKKNSRFPAKSRKQRGGIFCPRQIYGSKGSYRQNILNMGVSAITWLLGFRGDTAEESAWRCPAELSKIMDYLTDNRRVFMLS